jgi:hypothetical protein
MSAQDLIKNCVPVELQRNFSTSQEEFEGNELPNDMVFVAALWSGKSRLAFQRLVTCLAGHAKQSWRVLLIEDDSEFGQSLSKFVPTNAWGCGCVFRDANRQPSLLGSGIDLENLAESVEGFLAESDSSDGSKLSETNNAD